MFYKMISYSHAISCVFPPGLGLFVLATGGASEGAKVSGVKSWHGWFSEMMRLKSLMMLIVH